MATKESLTLTIAPPGAGPDDAHLKLTLTDMLKSDDIMHLKRTIAREIRRPAEWSQMTLYFTGIKLEDDQTLEHYGIQDEDEIIQVAPFDLRQVLQIPTPQKTSSRPTQRADVAHNHAWRRPSMGGLCIKNMSFIDLDGKTFVIHDIPIQASVKQLKEVLRHEKQLDVDFIRLVYAGKQFEDDQILENYNVQEDCTIIIFVRLRGGMIF